jgi:hypothetical protein
MEVCQIEQQIVEQNQLWEEMRQYVAEEALNQELHQVEENLFRRVLALGLSLLKEVLARHGSGQITGEVVIPDGQPLPYHSVKSRQYQSIFGLVEVERAYYWREGEQGAYPLDAKLNLPQRRYFYLLDKWVQGAIAEGPYDEATGSLSELLGIPIWKRGQEEIAREVTGKVKQFYEEKEPPDPETEGSVLCVTADCKGVGMVPSERPENPKADASGGKARRGKGEKKKGLRRDAVVTADYSFMPEPRTPEEMLNVLMHEQSQEEREAQREAQRQRRQRGQVEPRAPLNKQVSATMAGKGEAFKGLADRIERRDPEGLKPIYVQIDGDPALERGILEELQGRGWGHRVVGVCLDIMHTMEYLWEAGTALHGERGGGRESWVREHGLALLAGRVGRVIGGLRQTLRKKAKVLKAYQKDALHKAATYLDNHRHMMAYDEYLRAGYPIATGVIEGTCGSLVKDRTDRSGMKWTRRGVQAVLDLRALKRNGDWDAYWDYHISRERQRLYTFSVN